MVSMISILALSLDDLGAYGPVVLTIFGIVWTVFLMPWLRAKAAKEQDEAKRAAYLGALDRLDAAIAPSVAATQQTLVPILRAADPEPGRLTSAQQAQALDTTTESTLQHFSPEDLREIAGKLGITRARLGDVITTRIEASLLALKSSGQGGGPGDPPRPVTALGDE